MNVTDLLEFGFEHKEAKIYLTLLKVGNVTASRIAKETGLDRRTTYDVLARLIDKGFVGYFLKNNVKNFTATNPENLVEDLKRKQEKLGKLLPDLLKFIEQREEETEIEVLKGKEGLKVIGNDIIRGKHMHYSFGALSKTAKGTPIELIQFLRKIDKLGLKEKIIYEKGTELNNKIRKGQYKCLPKNLIPPTVTIIYDDIVALFLYEPSIIVIRIKNKEIAKTYRLYFDTFWKMAEKG